MDGLPPADERARYIYGIVPAGADATGLEGIGDPPEPVSLVRHGELAALVSTVPTDRPLGTPADLRGHARVLDTAAARGAVLPLRFGAVVRDTGAVADHLLAPHQEAFRGALADLHDTAQVTLRGTYRQERVLREVLADREDIARLRARVAAVPEAAAHYERLRLGELIAQEIAARRGEDTALALERLAPLAVSVHTQDAGTAVGDQAVGMSFLVDKNGWDAFEAEAESLARDWAGRIDMRLLGPLAPYDFATAAVADARPAEEAAGSWD